MSVLTQPTTSTHTLLVIGEVSHYHFYQSLNHHVSQHHRSSKYRPTTKKIIPSIPRQRCKAPPNSPLSFIRPQKLPNQVAVPPVDLLSTAVPSAPTSSPYRSHSSADLSNHLPRPRKVSFNEKVMVICTRFNDDDNTDQPSLPPPTPTRPYQARRHSTGERIMVDDYRRRWVTLVNTLKHWKPTTHSPPRPIA
ncbi:hypothetical protein BC941DRAFT_431599 [Chlamydoabsidia padenii]|nr:hypothetical protein BC941DRAFT_431599 [Chlamydoabsidia padenii]